MGFTSFKGLGQSVTTWGLAATVALGCIGCGTSELAADGQELASHASALREDNGLSLNGLSLNGLSLNGLSLNGLSLNGLSTDAFAAWFDGNPAGHDALMSYMVRCAVPAGQQRTFVDTQGVPHTWAGGLGLAPHWAGGNPATVAEQQIISSCLAAHANNYGVHVSISVLGRGADGSPIGFTPDELKNYARRESCFFGNVFTGEGLFAGNDRNALEPDESSARPCGLTSDATTSNAACAQVQRVGRCEQFCTLEPNGNFYTQCTLGGTQYKVLTTRMRTEDVHRCGDGVCQQGEHCGTGATANSCVFDCGTCD